MGRRPHLSFPIRISVLGGLVVLSSLSVYNSIVSWYPIDTGNLALLEGIAIIVVALVFAGLCMSLIGATRLFMGASSRDRQVRTGLTVRVLSLALNERQSFRAFALASLIYGLSFAFISSFLVFQPFGRFSESNGVTAPSTVAVICCGQLGQVPQFIVYFTQQFAILIIPLNLALLFGVSWLVGLNAAVATYTYKHRSSGLGSHWVGGLGAIVALFTACPTCAGFFLLTMLGFTGAVTFALTLSSLQALFIATGLPLLSIAPTLTARRIPKGWMSSCLAVDDSQVA